MDEEPPLGSGGVVIVVGLRWSATVIFVPVGALHDVVQPVPSQQLSPFVADVVVGVVDPPTTSRTGWL